MATQLEPIVVTAEEENKIKGTVFSLSANSKDLGKKYFAFSKFDIESFNILGRLK